MAGRGEPGPRVGALKESVRIGVAVRRSLLRIWRRESKRLRGFRVRVARVRSESTLCALPRASRVAGWILRAVPTRTRADKDRGGLARMGALYEPV